jgi:hypothetical protein
LFLLLGLALDFCDLEISVTDLGFEPCVVRLQVFLLLLFSLELLLELFLAQEDGAGLLLLGGQRLLELLVLPPQLLQL